MTDAACRRHLRRVAAAWLALLALMTLSLVSAYLPLHGWNAAAGVLIATLKAGIVAALFMGLARAPILWRLIALAALGTWWVLAVLSGIDYATRIPAPAEVQPAHPVARADASPSRFR